MDGYGRVVPHEAGSFIYELIGVRPENYVGTVIIDALKSNGLCSVGSTFDLLPKNLLGLQLLYLVSFVLNLCELDSFDLVPQLTDLLVLRNHHRCRAVAQRGQS